MCWYRSVKDLVTITDAVFPQKQTIHRGHSKKKSDSIHPKMQKIKTLKNNKQLDMSLPPTSGPASITPAITCSLNYSLSAGFISQIGPTRSHCQRYVSVLVNFSHKAAAGPRLLADFQTAGCYGYVWGMRALDC